MMTTEEFAAKVEALRQVIRIVDVQTRWAMPRELNPPPEIPGLVRHGFVNGVQVVKLFVWQEYHPVRCWCGQGLCPSRSESVP